MYHVGKGAAFRYLLMHMRAEREKKFLASTKRDPKGSSDWKEATSFFSKQGISSQLASHREAVDALVHLPQESAGWRYWGVAEHWVGGGGRGGEGRGMQNLPGQPKWHGHGPVKDANKPATEENIETNRFRRIPFGVVSSPYLLTATINHHLKSMGTEIALE